MIRSRRQPGLLRQPRGAQRRLDHRLDHHLAAVGGLWQQRVGIHHLGQQLLVERAPVDADADRHLVRDRDLDDLRELLVAALGADVSRVDAVLGKRGRRLGVLRQQQVAVVVEVADEGHVDPEPVELLADDGNRLRRGVVVDGDAHQLGSGMSELGHLDGGGVRIGRVGVRHRLHDDRVRRSDRDAADQHGPGRASTDGGHGRSMVERTPYRHAACTAGADNGAGRGEHARRATGLDRRG